MADGAPVKEDVDAGYGQGDGSFKMKFNPSKMKQKKTGWRFASRGLILVGLFMAFAAFIMYQNGAVSVEISLEVLGWGLFFLTLGIFIPIVGCWQKSSRNSPPLVKACWIMFIIFWILVMFNMFLGAIFGGLILCKDWYPLYDPDNGLCKCDATQPLFRTEDAPVFDPSLNATIKIATIGDMDISEAENTLAVVRDQNVDLLIINGDLTYQYDPQGLGDVLEELFEDDFPVVITVGNHDTGAFTDYQRVFLDRYIKYRAAVEGVLDDSEKLTCIGEIGVNQFCSFRGHGLVLSGLGSTCMSDPELNLNLESQLQQMSAEGLIWRTIFIHKNQKLLQIGTKEDEVGYEAFRLAIQYGGIVMNSHEHSYARTKGLLSVGEDIDLFQHVEPTAVNIADENEEEDLVDQILIQPGIGLVVQNGLGGKSIRDADEDLVENEWWGATFHAGSPLINYGAHICEYNYEGNERRAFCFFETTSGFRADEYVMVSGN